MRSDTDATRVADCFILDFPCLCEASGQPMTLLGARRRLRQTSIGTPLVAAVNPGPPGCVSAAIGARNWLRARTTASPIRRMDVSVEDGWRESSRTLGLVPAQRRGPSSRTDNGGHLRARRTPGEPFGCATKRLRPCRFGPFSLALVLHLGISFDRISGG